MQDTVLHESLKSYNALEEMDWPTTRAAYQQRLDALSSGPSVDALVSAADKAQQNYLEHPKDATARQQAQDAMTALTNLKGQYQAIHDDIIAKFSQYATQYDLAATLRKNGELQKSIGQLQKLQKDIRTDVESAVARDELLRSRETETTSHSLFLMNRPLRKEIVPYLWVLAVLFVGTGLVFFHRLSPSFLSPMPMMWYSLLTETLFSPRVILALLGACILTIIGLSLKVAGVF
jgi:hypothetical protein